MSNKLKEKFLILLKELYNEKLIQDISIININGNKDLIIQGISFDNEHTCYHDYDDIDDIITGLMVAADNYGIYLKNEFIGLVSVFYHHYKDLSRLEISISINKLYRNKNIGKYALDTIIYNCFEDPKNKSIHLSIREDNIKSRKMAESCGFELYKGYRCDDTFTDLNGNIIPQVQYLLKRKDYYEHN
ncbi:MAG: GNAT family N-acetyltransferase [Bacilli bacterium]|nr:GNAT family N-acetyltransferase [Bacilli bacterium]